MMGVEEVLPGVTRHKVDKGDHGGVNRRLIFTLEVL
jgi:hypothetical protein